MRADPAGSVRTAEAVGRAPQDRGNASGPRRPRSSTSSTPRSASAAGRARWCRPASRCRRAAPRRRSRRCRCVVAEPDQHLVQHDVVDDLHARRRPAARRTAGPAGSTGRPGRRRRPGPARAAPPRPRNPGPVRDDSSTSRPGRCAVPSRQVGGGVGDRRRVRGRVRAEREPAVVGHVQPLVPVAAPRSRPARCRRSGAGCAGWPPPTARTRRPRAPSRRRSRTRSQAARRSSTGTGVDVARLHARRSSARPPPAASTRARSAMSIAPLAGPRRPAPRSRCRGRAAAATGPSWRAARRRRRPRTRGAPASPSRSTSHPPRCEHPVPAAARPTVLAACAPVTNPTDAVAGRPSSSLSQPPATSSTDGRGRRERRVERHWSQPTASMSAAVAAGSEPPMTNPKKRGPAVRDQPGFDGSDAAGRYPARAAVGASRQRRRRDAAAAPPDVDRPGDRPSRPATAVPELDLRLGVACSDQAGHATPRPAVIGAAAQAVGWR